MGTAVAVHRRAVPMFANPLATLTIDQRTDQVDPVQRRLAPFQLNVGRGRAQLPAEFLSMQDPSAQG